MRESCRFRLERVSCGKLGCSRCEGTRPVHGPYWYAYRETGGRRNAKMHKRYIGRAPTDATPEQLRGLFERRQTARAEAAERKRRRDTRSDTSGSRTGDSSSGSANEGSSSSSSSSTSGGSPGSNTGGSSYRGRDGRSEEAPPRRRRRPRSDEADKRRLGTNQAQL